MLLNTLSFTLRLRQQGDSVTLYFQRTWNESDFKAIRHKPGIGEEGSSVQLWALFLHVA